MPLDAKKYLQARLEKLHQRILTYEEQQNSLEEQEETHTNAAVTKSIRKCPGSVNITLDDVMDGIKLQKLNLERPSVSGLKMPSYKYGLIERPDPIIKIILKGTPEIVLYENRSVSVLSNSEEGRAVIKDNQRYEYLTEGEGRKRYRYTKETQTVRRLLKTRSVNTECILKQHVASYVSNFEMFDTYKDLEQTTQSVDVDGQKHIQVTTYKRHGVDEFIAINRLASFKLALMLTLRILASNTYQRQQRRFRNMVVPNPLSLNLQYLYRLEHLWSFALALQPNGTRGVQRVTDISWCPNNGDVLAVAYQVFGVENCEEGDENQDTSTVSIGCVAVWNIKNPVNTERFYNFQAAATTVKFSPFTPKLIAVGLYDGSVHVYDISSTEHQQVAISQRQGAPYYEPVSDIQWIPHSEGKCEANIREPFLVLRRDSSITRYSIIRSPYLQGRWQLILNRIEVNLEGLVVDCKPDVLLANRHPQGISMCLDAVDSSIYYVVTDEGCLHKCSTTYTQQHLQALQLHEAGVNGMEFSPWSPKLYLTCGNDWCIRIWLMGILRPLLTLKHHMRPILKACWSTTHSSVIVAVTRSSLDIWDLKRSTLKPVSSSGTELPAEYTTFSISNCGRSLAVGNNRGEVHMLAFEDMPFPPHFQYSHLKKTLYDVIGTDQDLLKEVKSLGHIGYPKVKVPTDEEVGINK